MNNANVLPSLSRSGNTFSFKGSKERVISTKVKGIVIKARDYKENDKLLNIFTLEYGKITVQARGVKTAKSKLKPFCQSFCFGDFELTKTGAMYLLTGVNQVDSFFDITANIGKFGCGCGILEIVDKVCQPCATYPRLFIVCLKALKALAYGNSDRQVLAKFLLDVLALEGFKLNLERCGVCKSPFMSKIYLNLDDGEIVCTACKKQNNIAVSPAVHSAIEILSGNDYEKLPTIKLNDTILNEAQKLAVTNFNDKFMCKLKAINN